MSTEFVLEFVSSKIRNTLQVFGDPDGYDRKTPMGAALYDLFCAANTIDIALSPIGVVGGITDHDRLTNAAKPWADFSGALPDYDHPLRCVYESGIQYAVNLLANVLKVDDYDVCDGSEEFDGDLGGTMFNIVLAAMPKDQHGDPMHPSEVRDAYSALALDGDMVRKLREIIRLFIGAAYPVAPEINPRGHNWSEAYLDQALAAALALRDEKGDQPCAS